MKKLFTLIFFTVIGLYSNPIQAQKTVDLSFFSDNWEIFNPAVVDKSFINGEYGTPDNLNKSVIAANIRQQWIGLEGSPKFYSVSYRKLGAKVNFGGSMIWDVTDATSTYGIYGNYAYKLEFSGRRSFLHVGINAGLIRTTINTNKLTFDELEPLVENGTAFNYLYPDFSLGFLYRHGTNLYVGLSFPSLLSINTSGNGDGLWASERVVAQQHIYLLAGYLYEPGESPDFLYEPSIQIRYTPPYSFDAPWSEAFPLSISLNCRVYWRPESDEKLWLGLGLNTAQLAKVEFGIPFIFNDIKSNIGLGYQVPMGDRYLHLGHSIELKATSAF